MVSICSLLSQRDVKLQQTYKMIWVLLEYPHRAVSFSGVNPGGGGGGVNSSFPPPFLEVLSSEAISSNALDISSKENMSSGRGVVFKRENAMRDAFTYTCSHSYQSEEQEPLSGELVARGMVLQSL